MNFFENLPNEIFHSILNYFGFYYFCLLKQLNKHFLKNILDIESRKKEKNDYEGQIFGLSLPQEFLSFNSSYNSKLEMKQKRRDFYHLVNDFISRSDFQKLNIQFVFNMRQFSILLDPLYKDEEKSKSLIPRLASEFGLLNLLKYLFKNPNQIVKFENEKKSIEIKFDKHCAYNTAFHGNLECLDYLFEISCPYDPMALYNGAYKRFPNITNFLKTKKVFFDLKYYAGQHDPEFFEFKK